MQHVYDVCVEGTGTEGVVVATTGVILGGAGEGGRGIGDVKEGDLLHLFCVR